MKKSKTARGKKDRPVVAPKVTASVSQTDLDKVAKYLMSVVEDKSGGKMRRDRAAFAMVQLAKQTVSADKNKNRGIGRGNAPRPPRQIEPKLGKKERLVKEARHADDEWGAVLQ